MKSHISSSDRRKASLDGMLKEYEALRQEIMTSMQTRGTILTFLFTVVGAIFATVATTNNLHNIYTSLVLAFGVPAISIFALLIWIGEYERMQRAGKFLASLEVRYNNLTSSGALTWENHLREGRMHMTYPYNSTILGVMSLSNIGVVLGVSLLSIDVGVKMLFISLSVMLHMPIYFWASDRMKSLRN